MKKPFIWIVLIAALALAVLAFALTRPDTPQPTEPTTLPTTQAAEPTAPTTQATQPTQTTAPTQPSQTTVPTAPPTQPPTQPPHVHAYEDVVKEPTCTEGGYTTHTCSVCGDTYTDSEKDALGHSFGQWITVKEPTEAEEGKQERTCANCGTKEEKTLPKQEHVHDYTSEVTAPTCTEGGYTTYTCACGDSYKADEVPAMGHNFDVVVTPPTCTAGGYTTSTCQRCAKVFVSDETEMVDHTWGDWEMTVAPTEETEGREERTCSVCGKTEDRAIPKAEHQHAYTAKIIAPTCTEQGYTEYTCACGDSYKEDYTDALGHSYVKTVVEATCTEAGYTMHKCSFCGAFYTDNETAALGHMWTTWVEVQQATCLMIGIEERTCPACGSVETRNLDALGGMKEVTYATITYNGTLNVRSGPSADYQKLGTLASGSRVVVERTSQIGSQTWAAIIYLDYPSAWIRIDGYAELEKVQEPVGHIWGDWETTQDATCQQEGKQERTCTNCTEKQNRKTNKADHTWGEWEIQEGSSCTGGITKQRTCSVCGAQEKNVTAASHAYTHWTVHEEATCYKDGSRSRSCVNCGEVENDVIESSGHYFSLGWETVKRATATEPGEAQRDCDVCGHTDVFTIPAGHTRHDFEKVKVEATCTEAGYTHYTCKVCGLVDKKYSGKPNGHTWEDWEVTLEPQIGKVGYEQRTCFTCGETMAVAIPPLDENGNAYEQYVDPKVQVNPVQGGKYYSYDYFIIDGGTNVECVDFRDWGAPPSIWINEDGTMTVVYYNMAGERIEVMVYLPQDGYVRSCRIQKDGTFQIAQIGGYG